MDSNLVHKVAQVIYDKKGFNIIALDVKGVSSLADQMVIAEGSVDRHVIAIAKELQKQLSEEGEETIYTEGVEEGDWVILDYGDLMVHLFMPGLREKYQLERLFTDAKVIDLDIELESDSSNVL